MIGHPSYTHNLRGSCEIKAEKNSGVKGTTAFIMSLTYLSPWLFIYNHFFTANYNTIMIVYLSVLTVLYPTLPPCTTCILH